MADDYDIGKAFAAIEEELISSIIRNLKRHKAEEEEMDMEWSMWQTEQLQALEKYKQQNQTKFKKTFRDINGKIEELIRIANEEGGMDQEAEILEAIRNGFQGAKKASEGMTAEFFKLNQEKLESLIKATVDDMKKAETAVLRMANDQYRKIIYNAQVYANTGAGTYEKAVDMATRDFLRAGLNCITYANGARHTISDYADMAIRTASKRAYLQGEGMKRQEWGVHTVIVNKRGNPCPKCLPFCGKVLIDDVWSGGSREDGPYPLMSAAVDAGLYHPRCKDSHTTYFPGISTADDKWTKEELAAVGEEYKQEEWQNYARSQAEKYGRMGKYSLDKENRRKYAARKAEFLRKSVAKPDDSGIMNVVEIINRSVGAKAKNYDVFNPITGEIVHLAEGTRITQPKNHVIAGKGRERQIDCLDWLIDKYGGDPEEWTKEKGFGYVLDEYGEERKVELHWYQNPETGKVEMKIKHTPGGEWYIDE